MPGAFELPQAARCAAETGRFDAVICLGCVIRGATPHFEYISVGGGARDHGGGRRDTGVPDRVRRADDRHARRRRKSGPAAGRDNKGWEAAAAGIEMAVLFRKLGRAPPARSPSRPFGFEPGTARGHDS